MSAPAQAPLPKVRRDVRIDKGKPGPGGAPTWTLTDPLRHKYYQIDATCFLLFSIWNEAHSVDELVEIANSRFDQQIQKADVESFLIFLRRNLLCDEQGEESWRQVYKASQAAQHGVLTKLLHNYLFFKIPLFKPQAMLERLVPVLSPFFTYRTVKVMGFVALLGLFLVSRHWSEFLATTAELGSMHGILLVAVSLFVIKAFHELGHAVAAAYFGCRVPVVGVAFMMMTPMLYADVTDAWRLSNRWQRLAIDLAGVMAELVIACVASLAWVFLPEGSLKTFAFIAASTSWIMSVAINLNPLMRFDGYYAFSDFLGVENLQQRSFAFASWRLRRLLFAPRLPPPESLPTGMERTLTIYAFVVWIYRLILYTGIALLVYGYFFKLLGLLLFSVEIYVFVLRPIVGEIGNWRKLSAADVSRSRLIATSTVFALLIVLICVPLPTWVAIPASLTRSAVTALYAPAGAQVQTLHVGVGDVVTRGQPIASLVSPTLEFRARGADARVRELQMRLGRLAADAEDRAKAVVLQGELRTAVSAKTALENERERLELRAQNNGLVLELDRDLQDRSWVSPRNQVALIGGLEPSLSGYLSGGDLEAVEAGASGVFVSDDLSMERLAVRVDAVDRAGVTAIGLPELASTFGGAVKTKVTSGQLVAARNYYLVKFSMQREGAPHVAAPKQVYAGTVYVEGVARSIGLRALKSIAAVLLKEATF